MMRRFYLVLGLVMAPACVAWAEDKVTLKRVSASELDDAIAAHRGKIVVVDFWATYCAPCKKEFPNLVQIHKQYAGKVVAVSVTVDDEEDADKALKFLKQQNATFENYLLAEPAKVYQQRYQFIAVPCVLVFGKDGKLVRRFSSDDEEFTYKDVNKLIESLILMK